MFGKEKIQLKSDAQIIEMRAAGLVVAAMHAAVREALVPGATTHELDMVARGVLAEHGATSNFLGYAQPPFPGVLCVSVNDEVVHGIPGPRVIEAGDLVSIDAGAIVRGWHGDAAFSMIAGGDAAADPADVALNQTTEAGMWAGIAAMATGEYVNDIGDAVQGACEASGHHYGILEDFTGHGIGTEMHMAPHVVNYRARRKSSTRLVPGMCLAIEPMFTRGSIETIVADDDWTISTEDGSRASHWEHTVARHERGIWVLTSPDGGAAELAKLGVTVVPLA